MKRDRNALDTKNPLSSADIGASMRRWIAYAARSAPDPLRARLEEEWLAHASALRSPFARAWFALGCHWAGRVVTHEALASGVAATSRAGVRTLATFGPEVSFLSRRSGVLLLIMALHGLVLYAFLSGFGRQIIDSGPGVLIGHIVPSPPRAARTEPASSTKPHWSTPPLHWLPPDVPIPRILVEDSPQNPPLLRPTDPPLNPPPRVSAHRIAGGPGNGFPNADEYYPAQARRDGVEGAAAVRVCVDARGRLSGGPTIIGSSGSATLDTGALALARAGSGHYRSSTEDGRPVDDCYSFRVRFRLQQ